MKKNIVKYASFVCILALTMSMVFTSIASASQSITSTSGKYLPSEVLTALSEMPIESTASSVYQTATSSVYQVLNDVLLPSSNEYSSA